MIKFINKHKGLSILLGLVLLLLIILIILFVSLFMGNNGSGKYGNRLDGIEEVKLTSSFLKSVEDKILENENVQDATVRIQGKIVYIDFKATNTLTVDDAKNLSTSLLELFSEEELKFYNISYLISWETENEEGTKETKVIAGTKHPLKDAISWSKS